MANRLLSHDEWLASLSALLAEQEKEAEAMRKDAESFRRLRDGHLADWAICQFDGSRWCEARAASIDAAMQQE